MILVAHRLSTLLETDRILVFDQGRIVESGTYDELVRQGGVFTELVYSADSEVAVEPAVLAVESGDVSLVPGEFATASSVGLARAGRAGRRLERFLSKPSCRPRRPKKAARSWDARSLGVPSGLWPAKPPDGSPRLIIWELSLRARCDWPPHAPAGLTSVRPAHSECLTSLLNPSPDVARRAGSGRIGIRIYALVRKAVL